MKQLAKVFLCSIMLLLTVGMIYADTAVEKLDAFIAEAKSKIEKLDEKIDEYAERVESMTEESKITAKKKLKAALE